MLYTPLFFLKKKNESKNVLLHLFGNVFLQRVDKKPIIIIIVVD